MNELNTGFGKLSDLKFHAKASLIHTALTTVPGLTHFPITVPTMADYLTAVNLFGDAISNADGNGGAALRDSTREALVDMTQRLAADLELKANGNLVSLATTGYDLRKTPVRSTGPLPAPQNLRVRTTGTSGEAMCKCAAVPLADSYEIQWTLEPMAGPWTSLPAVSNSQAMLITGLQRGTDYYFRVRAIGANGPSGWSDVATMMVV